MTQPSMEYKSMVGRRSHRKSRQGCQQCKARKVKCDETKPACKNCVRHAIDCSFDRISVSHLLSPQTSEASSKHASSSATDLACRPLTDLNIRDLELLHHYSTTTSYTIARNPLLQTLWRVTVPQIGLSSPFVMRAVLSISALHLSYLRPEHKEYYISQAACHHEVALNEVSPILATLLQENSEGMLLFAALTCFIACAKPRKMGDFLLIDGGKLSQWLTLFRATRTITDFAGDALKAGPLALMFSIGERKMLMRESKSNQELSCILELKSSIRDEVTDLGELETYLGAVDELSKSFSIMFDPALPSCETSDVFIWLLRVSDEYMSLLEREKPVAMVIFAYYCVVLRQLEWTWWLNGWSIHVMSAIYQLLNEVYRSWVRWPMEQIGWSP
ncbi:hypothetical protein Egran_04310 [Elaphomyces granulatus]|uniref:Zn(2)-C6 fungal-type domain-containing protein n=1 Tax=Elaphomyces granulatus TaxID=519963 RepID=A0A232LV67_9EURO|nr:hypothetical protein Egran_04310 [Elaphomyces granulatus]